MPPLAIWATASLQTLFGPSAWTARAFSAGCGAGTVLVTYLLGRELLGRWPAFLGALVLLSTTHFLRLARSGLLDIPLTFFVTLAIYFFWLGRGRNRYLVFSGLAVGAAVMTKGYPGLYAVPVVWLYALLAREPDVLGRSSYWVGLMLAVLIALPWHLYQMFAAHEPFVGNPFETNWAQTVYYVRTFVNEYHPWALIGVGSVPYFILRAIRQKELEVIYLSVWIGVVVLTITAVGSKFPWYLSPAYPAASLTVGWALSRATPERYRPWAGAFFLMILAVQLRYF